jgi:hypothetical protein
VQADIAGNMNDELSGAGRSFLLVADYVSPYPDPAALLPGFIFVFFPTKASTACYGGGI